MDGLSVAASGIAVASVALQLAGSVKQIYEFWNSVKEAPDEIRAITQDLRVLSSVLARIANEAQHHEPEATLEAALNGCLANVKILTSLLKGIEPGFASTRSRTRKWSALKAVLKRGQLVKFREALEWAKSTLMLVVLQQVQSRLVRFICFSLREDALHFMLISTVNALLIM